MPPAAPVQKNPPPAFCTELLTKDASKDKTILFYIILLQDVFKSLYPASVATPYSQAVLMHFISSLLLSSTLASLILVDFAFPPRFMA